MSNCLIKSQMGGALSAWSWGSAFSGRQKDDESRELKRENGTWKRDKKFQRGQSGGNKINQDYYWKKKRD